MARSDKRLDRSEVHGMGLKPSRKRGKRRCGSWTIAHSRRWVCGLPSVHSCDHYEVRRVGVETVSVRWPRRNRRKR